MCVFVCVSVEGELRWCVCVCVCINGKAVSECGGVSKIEIDSVCVSTCVCVCVCVYKILRV